ncbi:branched-chain-amino-acid aminotransferase-like protein 2 [Anneissia japonica]|uniref:branched-chain-amino-acid aminotransferase-like protein 2 n=1 Tax=Anneissia japonica TaxID=1529436 RepID=UPI0014258222|nr:branched-chain-amino-acid aminotransferase-like protein 2 [Anneissia japonica]
MAGEQIRIVLWAIPRTLSTAFTISMSHLDDVQVINHPFRSAHRFCSDGIISDHYDHSIDTRKQYYQHIADTDIDDANTLDFLENFSDLQLKENIYEAEYPGKKVIFAREMMYAIDPPFEQLPTGYRHVFLIRDPTKVIASFEKFVKRRCSFLNDSKQCNFRNHVVFKPEIFFKKAFDLYEHLKKNGIDCNPVVIDCSDLLNDPEGTLRLYCQQLGIRFTENLVRWWKRDSVFKEWRMSVMERKEQTLLAFYENAFHSEGFQSTNQSPTISSSQLSEDANYCIKVNLKYYQRLHDVRIRPEQEKVTQYESS